MSSRRSLDEKSEKFEYAGDLSLLVSQKRAVYFDLSLNYMSRQLVGP